MQEEHYLHDIWTAYFHDPSLPDWTTRSYVRLCDVSSVEDFASLRQALLDKVPNGMFFLMREHVFPCWDDKHNIDGGCLSVKLPKAMAEGFWNDLCARVLGEVLWIQQSAGGDSPVNGVSISPKTYYSIIKVWLSRQCDPSQFDLPPGYKGELLYKPNRDTIRDSQTTTQTVLACSPEVPNTV